MIHADGRLTLRAELLLLAAAGGMLLALIAADAAATQPLAGAARLALGLAFTLLIPGYLLQAAAFPRSGQIDALERGVLSLVLSIALIPLLALLLDWTPGLRMDLPGIAAATGVACGLLAGIAGLRRARVPVEERFTPQLSRRLFGAGWRGQPVLNRWLIGVFVTAGAVALIAMAALWLSPGPGLRFTEFYILNPDGLAENLPRTVRAGDPVAMRVGVVNSEGAPVEYRVIFTSGDQVLDSLPDFTLADDEGREVPVQLMLELPAGEQDVIISLYRNDSAQPYRQLRLRFTIIR